MIVQWQQLSTGDIVVPLDVHESPRAIAGLEGEFEYVRNYETWCQALGLKHIKTGRFVVACKKNLFSKV